MTIPTNKSVFYQKFDDNDVFSQNCDHNVYLRQRSDESDGYTFFYKLLNFSSEPGVANEILENEAKSC